MRVATEQLEVVASEIVDNLCQKKIITPKQGERAYRLTRAILLREKEIEDELDRDTREILKKHSAAMWQEGVDPQALYGKIKRKLAEERGVVI